MLKRWKLKNFKSIRDGIELDLAPLTLITGANNSGKSSLIQSILMTKQTIETSGNKPTMVLNGSQVKLGTLKEIRSFGSEELITVGFACGSEHEGQAHQCLFVFGETVPAVSESAEAEVQSVMLSVNGQEDLTVKRSRHLPADRASQYGLDEDWMNRRRESNPGIHPALGILSFEVSIGSAGSPQTYEQSPVKEELVAAEVQGFLPGRLVWKYDNADVETWMKSLWFWLDDIGNLVGLCNPGDVWGYDDRWGAVFDDLTQRVPAPAWKLLISRVVEPTGLMEAFDESVLESLGVPFAELSDQTLDCDMCELLWCWEETVAKLDIRSRRRLKEKLEEHQEELLRTMRSGFEERVLVRYGPLNENLDQVVRSIRHQFSDKIFYLGPLRAEPRLVYPVTSNPDRADAA